MGKKMKFPFLFKAKDSTTTTTTSAATSPWPWPACVNNPKTLSFRANTYKTMNSAYLDDKTTAEFAETPDSFFSIRGSLEHSVEHFRGEESFSSEPEIQEETAVIRGLRSDRLFFKPGETNSILEEAKAYALPYSESVKVTVMDSDDPFIDFRASMAEMVETHGIKSWECLEELLTCYLRLNGKTNHGYIVGAFVDLLVHISLNSAPPSAIDEHCSSSSTTTQYSFTSPLSFSSSSTYSSTSPCLTPLENEDEIVAAKDAGG